MCAIASLGESTTRTCENQVEEFGFPILFRGGSEPFVVESVELGKGARITARSST